MYWNYREKILWGPQAVSFVEIVLIWERPLSEIPLYSFIHNIPLSGMLLRVLLCIVLPHTYVGLCITYLTTSMPFQPLFF